MAHGSPRLETCKKCNTFGLTPIFSESKCPDCGGEVERIEKDEVKRKLGLMIHEQLNCGFGCKKLEKQL